ncbi:MAG: hemerythrin domain-containing protein [Flavobacteriaceae bacterium]|nr:hemerythrin domain-containing protein [Flavobacteriaceae bacterium]
MAGTPIKRHKALQGVSREHHHGLLLCWKIRTGLSKKVAPKRIKTYVDWFFKTHLIPHFELEETYIFPILGMGNPKIKKALREHRRLVRLFTSNVDLIRRLVQIEEELEQHIRYEERQLFNEIQKIASDAQLDLIEKYHNHEKFKDNIHDPFWN